MKARNDIPIDELAINVNSSPPQLEIQSSTLVAADEDADIRRYARIWYKREKHNFSLSKRLVNIIYDVRSTIRNILTNIY